MRILKPFILAALMLCPWLAEAQIPAPQINLSGNIGCQGFACLNNGTLSVSVDADHVLTAQESSAVGGFKVTSTVSLTATRNFIIPAGYGNLSFLNVGNSTSGGQSIAICNSTLISCLPIPNGQNATGVRYDGTNVTGTVTGSSGSSAFSSITSGTNTGAAMIVGTGSSLSTVNLGTINATSISGVSITGTPAPGYVPVATSATTALWGTSAINVLINNPSGRTFGTVYQNTGTSALIVQATGAITGSYGQGFGITGFVGTTPESLAAISVGQVHNDQGAATETLVVPAGDYYKIAVDNTYVTNGQTPNVLYWQEQPFLGGGGGGGAVSSVASPSGDTSLTITPTTGAVTAKLTPTGLCGGSSTCTQNIAGLVWDFTAGGQIVSIGNPFSMGISCNASGNFEVGYATTNPNVCTISYSNGTAASASVSDGTNSYTDTTPYTVFTGAYSYTANTIFSASATATNGQTATASKTFTVSPCTFSGLTTNAAPTSATASGSPAGNQCASETSTLTGGGTLTSHGLGSTTVGTVFTFSSPGGEYPTLLLTETSSGCNRNPFTFNGSSPVNGTTQAISSYTNILGGVQTNMCLYTFGPYSSAVTLTVAH